MHRDRRNWAAYNAGVNGLNCEGSAWLGALQEQSASGASVDVFKSWAQRRRDDPKHILLERRFKHPLLHKIVRSSKKYRAHDADNRFKTGDTVRIVECAPISKTKRWTVVTEDAQATA